MISLPTATFHGAGIFRAFVCYVKLGREHLIRTNIELRNNILLLEIILPEKITAMIKNRHLILLIFIMAMVNSCMDTEGKFEDVSKERFAELIKSVQGLIVDLRTPEEFNDGHIDESVNIDYYANNFEGEIDKLDKSQTMYIYCASGGRSGSIFKLMKEKGFKAVYHLLVGYQGWSEE